MQAPPEPAFVKLDKIGDGFSGTVVSVVKQKFDDGTEAPQISFFDDADGVQRDWTVGQTDAKRKCAELRPETGDHIAVRFTGTTGKFKHIDVQVRRGGAQNGAAQQTAQQPAQQQPAQSYQAAPPPVYAVNQGQPDLAAYVAGNGNGGPTVPTPQPGTPPQPAPSPTPAPVPGPPPGVDPTLWARMTPEQRTILAQAAVPAPY
jgi:hypothetical protein